MKFLLFAAFALGFIALNSATEKAGNAPKDRVIEYQGRTVRSFEC